MAKRPDTSNSFVEQELDKAEAQFKEFDNQVKEMTQDRMNQAPKIDVEPQTKLSQSDIAKSKDIYLKPKRTIGSPEKFNEKYREDYNFKKEYVQFIAENKEILGEDIELWTKTFPGVPCENWVVPTNKPVWGPRYLAEQIRGCVYHRMSMRDNTIIGSDGKGQYFGSMAVDATVPRLTAEPISGRKSVFSGANAF